MKKLLYREIRINLPLTNHIPIGYMYRFNPQIQEALAKVRSGVLGNIYSVEAHMDCKHPAEVRQAMYLDIHILMSACWAASPTL